MDICNRHDVVYLSRNCPVCELEDLANKDNELISDLTLKLDVADEEINELTNELADIKQELYNLKQQ